MVTVSLREIGTFIDPVDEVIGLSHVATHHRWVEPPPVASLAALGRRHSHPETVRLRFLWFNTFLMRVRVNVAAALADGVTPSEVMEALKIEPKSILDAYDVCDLLPSGIGPVPGPGPRELCHAAGDAAEFVIGYFGGTDEVVDKIINSLGAKKAIELMLAIAGVPGEIQLDAKPALKARGAEIGDMLRDDAYQLVSLCETWNSDVRYDLLDHWGLPDSEKHLLSGAEEGPGSLGDGLLFGSPEGRIVDTERYTYDTRGIDRTPGLLIDMLADDELWARKGCALARIQVGVGVIDLYLTHLYFGTGLVGEEVGKWFGHVSPPNNQERREVRAAQLHELEEFIDDTHDPANVLIVSGDFNIDANDHDPSYGGLADLQQFAKNLHLEDRWVSAHPGLWGATEGDFSKNLDPMDPRFCMDSDDVEGGNRIDFIFVERPSPQHAFTLDVTRIRRRPFPRAIPTDGQESLSDHLGLDCTLQVSPL